MKISFVIECATSEFSVVEIAHANVSASHAYLAFNVLVISLEYMRLGSRNGVTDLKISCGGLRVKFHQMGGALRCRCFGHAVTVYQENIYCVEVFTNLGIKRGPSVSKKYALL